MSSFVDDPHRPIGFEIKEALACRTCREESMLCSVHPLGASIWRAIRKSIPAIMQADRRVRKAGRRKDDPETGPHSYFCGECKHWRLSK